MSELTNCKFCKQTVAINAQTCPHCGGIDPVEHKKNTLVDFSGSYHFGSKHQGVLVC